MERLSVSISDPGNSIPDTENFSAAFFGLSVLPKASITPKETQCPFRLLKHKEKVSLTSLKVATLPKSMTERAEMDVKFAGEGI